MKRLLHCLWLFVLIGAAHGATNPPPFVGMEGRIELALPGTLLEAKPVDDRSVVVLRVADSQPHGTLIRYDLRYVGMEPGGYDLRDFLVRKDGSSTADLPAIPVTVAGRLSVKHDGLLADGSDRRLPRLGGYTVALIAAGTIWIGVLGWLVVGRRRKTAPVATHAVRTETLADRLRPLVEQAALGQLPPDGQARLERMLVQHWRQKLGLEDLPLTEALARMKAHPESGQLLRELESWLHRPPGSAPVDVATLLAPYRETEVAA